jgi:hypothetical protein
MTTSGTSDRETIISTIFTALEAISVANGYVNNPKVLRTKQAWQADPSKCVLYCEEFEPEEVKHLAFGLESGLVNMVAAGKVLGDLSDINSLVLDIRTALESALNPFSPYLTIIRAITYGNYVDATDPYFYCEVSFNILYDYDVPIQPTAPIPMTALLPGFLGYLPSDPDVSTWGAAQNGVSWYNNALSQYRYWTGSSIEIW